MVSLAIWLACTLFVIWVACVAISAVSIFVYFTWRWLLAAAILAWLWVTPPSGHPAQGVSSFAPNLDPETTFRILVVLVPCILGLALLFRGANRSFDAHQRLASPHQQFASENDSLRSQPRKAASPVSVSELAEQMDALLVREDFRKFSRIEPKFDPVEKNTR